MQVYTNSNRVSIKIILFFLIVLIAAFLPIASFQFFLKNDTFNGYFPPKFFMSESIHAGHLPLWNPYINFGIPQYGDMSSGFWSPITWLIASTAGYNTYTLTLELLFYILLGGLGMYNLLSLGKINKQVKIIAGIAFMCCGYTVGHLQHFNWLSGAAFLPWCLWSYYLVLTKPFALKNAVLSAIIFYLLIASAHPGISIGAVYFFLAIMIFYFFKNENHQPLTSRLKSLSISHLVFLLLLVLLSAGMITGYLDILPHFSRGNKISLASSLANPSTAQSWISTLLPFSTVKNDAFFNTDISMRNCYFSLTLLLFFILALLRSKTGWQKFLLYTGLAFALLASGGVFKTIAYKFLPMIGYVRLNGEFRIFALLCFILIAALELNKFIEQKNKFEGIIKWVYYSLEIILFACIITGMMKAFGSKDSFVFSMKNIISENGMAQKLKALVDAISFYDTIWVQGCIQLLLLWGIKYSLINSNWNLLKKIVVADMIIACLLNIPYTGAGKASVAEVQAVLNKSPNGIPIPALQPIKYNDTLSAEEKGLVGDWSMYNKQIGVVKEAFYPVLLNNTDTYFKASEKNSQLSIANYPFIFTAGIITDSIVIITSYDTMHYPPKIKNYNPTKISLSIHSENKNNLVLLQNFYPHWYYDNTNEKIEVQKAGYNFIYAPIKAGENNITFSFEPALIKWMMLLSGISFLVCSILFFALKSKSSSPS